MFKILAFGLICFSAGQAAAAEPRYSCKGFADDYKQLHETSKDPGNPNFSYGVGFLIGTYRAKTDAPEIEGDIPGIKAFETQVIKECEKSPNERPSTVILALASKLQKIKPEAAKGEFIQVSVTDFQLDAKELKGKKVEVTGFIQSFAGFVLLSDERFSTNKIYVEPKSLPREQRKYILENCESICEMTVRGKAGEVSFSPGIVASEAIAH